MHGINSYCNGTLSCAVGRVQVALFYLGKSRFNANSVKKTTSSILCATLWNIQSCTEMSTTVALYVYG
jgi:hypothetical protein